MEELKIGIDWISFTCDVKRQGERTKKVKVKEKGKIVTREKKYIGDVPITYNDLLKTLGLSIKDFNDIDRGALGYMGQMRHKDESIRILYDGNDDMGVHIDISGKSIPYVLSQFVKSRNNDTPFGTGFCVSKYLGEEHMTTMLSELRSFGKFTRLDIAIDDFTKNYFTVGEVASLCNNFQCVSLFRSRQEIKEQDFAKGKCSGHTVSMGSRSSDLYLRIYDKKLEQEKKGNTVDKDSWVRWEMEFKDKYANKVVEELCNGSALGSVGVGVLSHYVRFINLDYACRSRCTTLDKWERFIGNIEPLRLYVPPKQKTVLQKERWIKKQVLPTLSMLFLAHGGSDEYMNNLLYEGYDRMTKTQHDAVDAYIKEQEEERENNKTILDFDDIDDYIQYTADKANEELDKVFEKLEKNRQERGHIHVKEVMDIDWMVSK